jgi:hypothetical protein
MKPKYGMNESLHTRSNGMEIGFEEK